ncbi:MAG: nucleotide exchange factor GrpE [Pseudomonadota bacterium]
MSDETKPSAVETPSSDAPESPELDAETAASETSPWLEEALSGDQMEVANLALKAADERIAELEAEAGEAKDRALRAIAEMENLRRRTEREVRDAKEYSIAKFATDILSVGDNLRRALDTVTPEIRGEEGSGVDGFVTGVEMTEREFLSVLERNKIARFDPTGEKFDPNAHQAMFEVEDKETPAGTVVQVMQAGYRIGERVLRPAFVGVAKGGPKSVPTPVEAAPEGADPTETAGATVDKTA